MDISFQWSGSLVTVELKAKVEEDIRKEMPGLIERFPNPPNEFMVSLYLRDSLSNLEGSATAAGKTLVKSHTPSLTLAFGSISILGSLSQTNPDVLNVM